MNKQLAALNGTLYGGAKPKFTKKLGIEICSALATSTLPLTELCKGHPEWPGYWSIAQYRERHEWFRRMLNAARAEQAEVLVQDNTRLPHNLAENPPDSMAHVQARKVAMEDRRWYASKMLRAQYGDDPSVNVTQHSALIVIDEQLKALRENLDKARRIYALDRGSERPALLDEGTGKAQS
jgi:terminase small subunit-like protein